MAWTTLGIGLALLLVGFGGQILWIARTREPEPDVKQARRWLVGIGSLVAGLWLVALSAVKLLQSAHPHL
jgi:hypothetical protein